jgi:hypothetical protein
LQPDGFLRDPDARHKGTGMDEASLRERLKETKAEVVYRRKLLAGLDAQIAAYDPHK